MTIAEFHKLQSKSSRGKAAASEHDLQVGCVNVFRMLYPEYDHLLMAIPNGGFRTQKTAVLMKREGVVSGVPDMFLAVPRKGYPGLWIEMTNGKAGRVSDNQKEMMSRLTEQGYKCVACRTLDEFVKTLQDYL